MNKEVYEIHEGNGPIIAAAIHSGHELRAEVAELVRLSDREREYEEDPYTTSWTAAGDIRIICNRSRFEVDLNRPRDRAMYVEPEDAWGLSVYRQKPPQGLIETSLREYDDFYKDIGKVIRGMINRYGRFVLLDIHSYNHRRDGAEKPPADPEKYPEVNIGTGTILTAKWKKLVERFMADLRGFNFQGRNLDVRENVIFKGGHFPKWVNREFLQDGCAIAIEFKKFWMDEWTGEIIKPEYDAILEALKATINGLREELGKVE